MEDHKLNLYTAILTLCEVTYHAQPRRKRNNPAYQEMKQRKMRKKRGGRKRRDLKAVKADDLIGELDFEIDAMENTLTSFTEMFDKTLSASREDGYPFE